MSSSYGVEVVFSAPRKNSGLCVATDPNRKKSTSDRKHRETFFKHTTGAIYQTALTCGSVYVGQAGRRVNEHLQGLKYLLGVSRMANSLFAPVGASVGPH